MKLKENSGLIAFYWKTGAAVLADIVEDFGLVQH